MKRGTQNEEEDRGSVSSKERGREEDDELNELRRIDGSSKGTTVEPKGVKKTSSSRFLGG